MMLLRRHVNAAPVPPSVRSTHASSSSFPSSPALGFALPRRASFCCSSTGVPPDTVSPMPQLRPRLPVPSTSFGSSSTGQSSAYAPTYWFAAERQTVHATLSGRMHGGARTQASTHALSTHALVRAPAQSPGQCGPRKPGAVHGRIAAGARRCGTASRPHRTSLGHCRIRPSLLL